MKKWIYAQKLKKTPVVLRVVFSQKKIMLYCYKQRKYSVGKEKNLTTGVLEFELLPVK